MDGATKIVKGDAVMSLITTAINLIGGKYHWHRAVGRFHWHCTDYLFDRNRGRRSGFQIPALLISTATGMIVTRAVSEGSLNEDVSHQFTAQPHAIMISGLAVLIMALIPGMPKVSMFIIAGGLIGGGYYLSTRIQAEPSLSAASLYRMESGAKMLDPLRQKQQQLSLLYRKRITLRMLIMYIPC